MRHKNVFKYILLLVWGCFSVRVTHSMESCKELIQTQMTQIGQLSFPQAVIKATQVKNEVDFSSVGHHLSDDQKLFLNVLALPYDFSFSIMFGEDDKCNQSMINCFCSQPFGKACELYTMLAEKYAKDKKLASLIPFSELFINAASYGELYSVTKYFSRNSLGQYSFNIQQRNALYLIPDSIKKDKYFSKKKFIRESRNRTIENIVKLIIMTPLFTVFLFGVIFLDGKTGQDKSFNESIGKFCFALLPFIIGVVVLVLQEEEKKSLMELSNIKNPKF